MLIQIIHYFYIKSRSGSSFLLVLIVTPNTDAESFDYGNGFYGLGERAGVGFKVAILHPLDIPIMESTAMNVDVGKVQRL